MSERQASARSCAMPTFRNQNRPDEPIGPVEDTSRQIHLICIESMLKLKSKKQQLAVSFNRILEDLQALLGGEECLRFVDGSTFEV